MTATLTTAAVAAALALGASNAAGASAAFEGRRAVRSYEQTLEAPPRAVFPLLCPVRENEWAEGWAGRAVYARSGVAELDGVYATSHPGERDDTVWLVTRHDAARGEIEMVYFTPGQRVARLTLALSALPGDRTRLKVEYTATGLSRKGNDAVERDFAPEAFRQRMVAWETALNHYLRTGQLLRGSHHDAERGSGAEAQRHERRSWLALEAAFARAAASAPSRRGR